MDLLKFLKQHDDILKRSAVEKAAGMKPGIISRILKGEKWRHIDSDQHAKAIKKLERLNDSLNKFLKP